METPGFGVRGVPPSPQKWHWQKEWDEAKPQRILVGNDTAGTDALTRGGEQPGNPSTPKTGQTLHPENKISNNPTLFPPSPHQPGSLSFAASPLSRI